MQAEEEKGEEEASEAVPISSLGLAALFPSTAICGEWPPSGVLNVTCPDREESWHPPLSGGVGGAQSNPNASFQGLGAHGKLVRVSCSGLLDAKPSHSQQQAEALQISGSTGVSLQGKWPLCQYSISDSSSRGRVLHYYYY